MSLKKCPDCGHEKAASAPSCTNCGSTKGSPIHPVVKIIIILVICSVVIWVGSLLVSRHKEKQEEQMIKDHILQMEREINRMMR